MSAEVIAWLRSPEGERWSRDFHGGPPQDLVIVTPWWRSWGRRNTGEDPCGRGPKRAAKHAATRRSGQ